MKQKFKQKGTAFELTSLNSKALAKKASGSRRSPNSFKQLHSRITFGASIATPADSLCCDQSQTRSPSWFPLPTKLLQTPQCDRLVPQPSRVKLLKNA
jgi:hypothetical protein